MAKPGKSNLTVPFGQNSGCMKKSFVWLGQIHQTSQKTMMMGNLIWFHLYGSFIASLSILLLACKTIKNAIQPNNMK